MRFRYRHTHKTICRYIETQLTTLGWVNAPVNFGTTPLTFVEIQPDENGEPVAVNTVAITLGDGPVDTAEELGDGLYSVAYPFFVDVYGENQSIAVSIAEDVKDVVNHEISILLFDWTDPNNPVEQTDYMTFERVSGPQRPPISFQSQDFRRHWRVVKGLARLYYEA